MFYRLPLDPLLKLKTQGVLASTGADPYALNITHYSSKPRKIELNLTNKLNPTTKLRTKLIYYTNTPTADIVRVCDIEPFRWASVFFASYSSVDLRAQRLKITSAHRYAIISLVEFDLPKGIINIQNSFLENCDFPFDSRTYFHTVVPKCGLFFFRRPIKIICDYLFSKYTH